MRTGRLRARRAVDPWMEPLEPRTLLSAPAAELDVQDLTAGGNPYHAFVVTYTADEPIDDKSIDRGDLAVTGPGGQALAVRQVARFGEDGQRKQTVVYRVEAPGGLWDAPDNGLYTITLREGEVRSESGEAAPEESLGAFAVDASVIDLDDGHDANLGDVVGVKTITNLNTLVGTSDSFVFRLPATGGPDDFVRIDYYRSDGFLKLVPVRLDGNARTRRVGSARQDRHRDGLVSRWFSLAGEPAGTYSVTIDGSFIRCDESDDNDEFDICYTALAHGNPNYTLTIRSTGDRTPDLAGELDLSHVPDTVAPGERIKPKLRVTNVGDGVARGRVNVNFFLSADATLDDGDRVVGTSLDVNVGGRPGAKRASVQRIDLPPDVPAGRYYLLAQIDTTDLLPELDETNNVAVGAATIEVGQPSAAASAARSAALIRTAAALSLYHSAQPVQRTAPSPTAPWALGLPEVWMDGGDDPAGSTTLARLDLSL
jgi:CARDB